MKKKRVLGVCIVVTLVMVLAAGCATFRPVASGELVGSWGGTVTNDADGSEMEVEFEFKSDGTFSESIVGTPITFSGIYSIDPDTSMIDITVTETSNEDAVPVGASFQQDIVISRDGKTFKASGAGSSGVFHRK